MSEEPIVWAHDVRLLTDRFVMGDLVRVFGLAIVVAQLLVGTLGWLMDGVFMWFPPVVLTATTGTITVLVILACLLLGDRVRVVFSIGPQGAEWRSVARERTFAGAGAVVGTLAASPKSTAASLIAASRQDELVPWSEVHRVTGYAGEAVIELRDSWHVALRVWCEPDLYPVVLAACERFAAEATGRRAAVATGPYTPWPVRVGWAFATLALAAGGVAWAWDDDVTHRALGLAVLALAASCLSDGSLRRLGGFLGLGASLWYAGYLVLEATDPVGPIGMYHGRTWEIDTPMLAVSVLSVLALIGLAAWRLLGRPSSA